MLRAHADERIEQLRHLTHTCARAFTTTRRIDAVAVFPRGTMVDAHRRPHTPR